SRVRQIDRAAVSWENASDEENIGTEDLIRIDTTTQRHRVVGVGAETPHGGKTPSRQHRLHMRGKRRRRRAGGVIPYGFGEMDVAVPEARNDGLSVAINDPRISRNLH